MYIKGDKKFSFFKIFGLWFSRVSHKIARKNIKCFPQLAILSFDHIGLCINLEGRYENESLDIIEKYIKKRMLNSYEEVMLDVGANIGNHSVFFSNYFKKVISFEPNPVVYKLLDFNSKYACKNNNIYAFNFGLSDSNAFLPFLQSKTNTGGSSVAQHSSLSIESDYISIPVKRFDDIECLENDKITFIKIDVEGHEINVLKGAENLLVANKPAIIFEQSCNGISNGSSLVIDYLKSLGYKFYVVEKNFYFGNGRILLFLGFVLRSIFGSRSSLVPTNYFNKRFYHVVLAVHD